VLLFTILSCLVCMVQCVFCEVEIEFWHVVGLNFRLWSVKLVRELMVIKEGWAKEWLSANLYPGIHQMKGSNQWTSYVLCFPSLFQIISNKDNGIDVDRWDYFLRDGHQLNLSISFDYSRLLEFCRVIDVEGERIICFRNKERHNIYDMFLARVNLYHNAYYHNVAMLIEEM
jgi:hypothetical protein